MPSSKLAAALLGSSALLGAPGLASAQNDGGGDDVIVVDLPNGTYPVPAPKSRWLTLDEWTTYLESESGEEFGFHDESTPEEIERAEDRWDSAVRFQWGQCAVEEELPAQRRCTYVVCHESQDEAKSGYRRKLELLGKVPEDEREDLRFMTIWNSVGVWCGYGRLRASTALEVGCDEDEACESIVTPLMLSMKMMPKTIQTLVDAIEELYGSSNLTELIEGQGGPTRERRKLERKTGRQEQRDRKLRRGLESEPVEAKEVGENGDPEEAEKEGGPSSRPPKEIEELPAADFYLAPGVIDEAEIEALAPDGDASDAAITEALTYYLLSQTGSADPSSNETNPLAAENIFWTSSRAEFARERNETGRARFWADVFRLTLETTACDDTFRNRFAWTGDLRLDDFSVLTVKYDDTAAKDEDEEALDAWCLVAMIASLAAHVDVVAAEIKPRLEERNVNAAWLTQTGLENKFPWFEHGLNGTGQVVAVSDTGIDINNCYFWDTQNPISEANRKIVEYVPYVNDDDYTYGHGTHVAGTIVGKKAVDGTVESKGMADAVAKGAKVAFMDIGDSAGRLFLPSDSILLATGRVGINPDDWAHVHSASWGSVGINYYSSQARSFDNYMFDNPDFLINVAAGNDGRNDAYYTVSSPATFKNGLAVGCSHSTGYDLADGMLGPSYIADFSSKGPTADGRMTPMLVAPGKYILSAGALPNTIGECDGGIPSAGGGQAGLKSMAGTSMATPVVSGNAALVQQYFREGYYPTGRKNAANARKPSAALVKAVLMNGAQTKNMNGVDNGRGDVTPVRAYDNIMGFGVVSLVNSLYIEGWSDVQAKVWDGDQYVVQDGQTMEEVVTIDKSNGCTFQYLSVTLVWVEAGSVIGCAKCVRNDLDLYITDAAGNKYYPNGKSEPDSVNNAERIVISGVEDRANFTIFVEGRNMDTQTQKYALVATGCFGGVKNTLDTSGNAFALDNSAEDRRNRIIIICCSVFGGLLFLGLGCWWWKKRQAAKEAEEYGEPPMEEAPKGKEVEADKDVLENED